MRPFVAGLVVFTITLLVTYQTYGLDALHAATASAGLALAAFGVSWTPPSWRVTSPLIVAGLVVVALTIWHSGLLENLELFDDGQPTPAATSDTSQSIPPSS